MAKCKIISDVDQDVLERAINNFIKDKHVISISLSLGGEFIDSPWAVAILYEDDPKLICLQT